MGLITLAISLGFILGPAITSFTTSTYIFQNASLSTPFWTACVLSTLNVLGVKRFLIENFEPRKKYKIPFKKMFLSFLFIFKDLRVRNLGIVHFLLSIGFGMYITGVPLILSQVFNFRTQIIGLFYCALGLGFAFSILLLQPKLLKKTSLKNIYLLNSSLVGIILITTSVFPNLRKEWIITFVFGAFEILCYSSLLALISGSVTHMEQGKVMGGLGAVTSVSFLLNSFFLPFLYQVNDLLPNFVTGISFLMSALLMLKTQRAVN